MALIVGIRLYRVTLGGMLGGQCRFHPSCSVYAEEAIRTVGATRGSALAIWRVLRCSPLSAGGVDYPPARQAQEYDAVIHRVGVGA
jgi:putative membrane protein insertion efficiency factor